MSFRSFIAATSTALVLVVGAANASPVSGINPATVDGTFSGDFVIDVVNVTNLNSTESQATMANYSAAAAGTLGTGAPGAAPVFNSATLAYSGALNFGTTAGSGTTIGDFLNSAGGTLGGLDTTFADLINSTGNIGTTTATTTFYYFQAVYPHTAGAFNIAHDDGVLVEGVGGVVGPTSLQGTRVEGFAGGLLSFLYVSTNSDPSIFRVDSDVSAVPLPAAGWMLLAGLGGLFGMRRLRKAA
jgi:hypothetical protein